MINRLRVGYQYIISLVYLGLRWSISAQVLCRWWAKILPQTFTRLYYGKGDHQTTPLTTILVGQKWLTLKIGQPQAVSDRSFWGSVKNRYF
jgi:hypothetical protein